MKKSQPFVLLFLLVALTTLVCVVGLHCSKNWRAERGFTFDDLFDQKSALTDPQIKELDEALKRAETERQKIKTVLVKRSKETQESAARLAQAFKEFDKSERETIKAEFNSGRLSPQYEERAEVAKAFVIFQEARALKRDEDSLRALYDRFDVAITRAESERAKILRRAETNELLGKKEDQEEDDQRSELIDRLTALADETAKSNANEDARLLPSDAIDPEDDSDAELLNAVVEASNSEKNVETFLNDEERNANLEVIEPSETPKPTNSPIRDALKGILTSVVFGGITTLFVFAVGLYYLICPVRNTPNATSGGAPVLIDRPCYKNIRFYIFIAFGIYGWNLAGLPGTIGLGFIGLIIWRAPIIVRNFGVFRFLLLALFATFVVFLILIALTIL